MGKYPDSNREQTVPHSAALPIELYLPKIFLLIFRLIGIYHSIAKQSKAKQNKTKQSKVKQNIFTLRSSTAKVGRRSKKQKVKNHKLYNLYYMFLIKKYIK